MQGILHLGAISWPCLEDMSAIYPVVFVPYIPFYRYWTISSATDVCASHKICSINSPAVSFTFLIIFGARNVVDNTQHGLELNLDESLY
jgi:hypothetical protein